MGIFPLYAKKGEFFRCVVTNNSGLSLRDAGCVPGMLFFLSLKYHLNISQLLLFHLYSPRLSFFPSSSRGSAPFLAVVPKETILPRSKPSNEFLPFPPPNTFCIHSSHKRAGKKKIKKTGRRRRLCSHAFLLLGGIICSWDVT